ncbi:hypothetical protein [Kribbella sp. CA-294648]|uniref:hypothetical protein n=1 Tax=Kribbella sp. CA-294648 TaxID=3239948 RepID=UPI003D92F131
MRTRAIHGASAICDALRTALDSGEVDSAVSVYAHLAEVLFLQARIDELEKCLDDGRRFAEAHGLGSLAPLEVYQALLSMRSGDP